MERRARALAAALVALSTLAVADRADAQQVLCTSGPTRSCGAFDLAFSGTTLLVRAQNLQGLAGLAPGDNTGGSAIWGISVNWNAPIANAGGFTDVATTTGVGVTTYGAPAPWRWRTVGSTASLELLGTLDNSYIEGVNASPFRNDPFVSGTWATPGAPGASYVQFAVPTDGSLSLGQVASIGFVSQAANGDIVGCSVAGDTFGFYGGSACVAASVVPEPATIALSASGLVVLAGVGALRRRRSTT